MKIPKLLFVTLFTFSVTSTLDAQQTDRQKALPENIQELAQNYITVKSTENLIKLAEAIIETGDYKKLSHYSREISDIAEQNKDYIKYKIYATAGEGNISKFEELIKKLPRKDITDSSDLSLAITKSLVYLLNIPPKK